MFASIKNFLSRHRRKFLITGVVIGGSVLAVRYAFRRLRELQEEQAREFFERTRRAQYFESTERTCNQAIIGLAPSVCEQVLKINDTEPILEQLRHRPANKVELWNELKVLAFTRLSTLVYVCTMLVIILRIQINLLGGYLFKDNNDAGKNGNSLKQLTPDMQQNYLSMSQFFLSHGVDRVAKLIETKVRNIMSSYDLSQKLTLSDTEQIFYSIQMAVNTDACDPNSHLSIYAFPDDDNLTVGESELYKKIFAETLDMLENEDTATLCTNNVSRGFSIIMDAIADFYSEITASKPEKLNGNLTSPATLTEISTDSSSSNNSTSAVSKSDLNSAMTNINDIQIPLPKLIPILNGLAAAPFSQTTRPFTLSTSLITLYITSEKVQSLGANVYEVFCQ